MTAQTAVQRLREMLRLRPWTYFVPYLWPGAPTGVATPLSGAGTGAVASLVLDSNLAGTLELRMGNTGLVGTDLVQVAWATNPSSGTPSVLLLPLNSAAIALAATVSSTSAKQFTISDAAPTPGATYEWSFAVTFS